MSYKFVELHSPHTDSSAELAVTELERYLQAGLADVAPTQEQSDDQALAIPGQVIPLMYFLELYALPENFAEQRLFEQTLLELWEHWPNTEKIFFQCILPGTVEPYPYGVQVELFVQFLSYFSRTYADYQRNFIRKAEYAHIQLPEQYGQDFYGRPRKKAVQSTGSSPGRPRELGVENRRLKEQFLSIAERNQDLVQQNLQLKAQIAAMEASREVSFDNRVDLLEEVLLALPEDNKRDIFINFFLSGLSADEIREKYGLPGIVSLKPILDEGIAWIVKHRKRKASENPTS